MAKRNAFDLTCAQDVFRINRDEGLPQPDPPPSIQPFAVARRRNGEVTRVTKAPAASKASVDEIRRSLFNR